MERYIVRPYKDGKWVIAEVGSSREIILFNSKESAKKACKFLNDNED